MARTNNLSNFLTDVADAIRTKKGSEEPIAAADFDTEIENLPSGSGAIEEKDVNFYDYDGTLVNSYTKNEFLALNEMPANPTHNGLTAQGWNWNLQDAKTYVTDYGKLNVGQMYNTDDNSIRITIRLEDGRLSPYLGFAVNGTATIDWGDGSSPQNVTGTKSTTVISTPHTYSASGEYVISIYSEKHINLYGDSSVGSKVLWDNKSNTIGTNRGYQNAIQKIEANNNVSYKEYAFYSCRFLKTATISSTATDIGNSAFQTCASLTSITIPNSVTSIGQYEFGSCYSLVTATLPNSITNISYNSFATCRALKSITIPSSVTIINGYAFQGCTFLTTLTIPNSVTTIYNYAFSTCESLKSITIPNTISDIYDSAFRSCGLLTSITIPSSVVNIPANFCSNCGGLSSVKISNGVTSIGREAFNSCSCLTAVTIPSSVTSIGNDAFSSCYSVAYYDLSNHTSIPTLANTSVFVAIADDCKIIVPDDLYEDWIAATNWSNSAIVNHIIKKSDWDTLQNA